MVLVLVLLLSAAARWSDVCWSLRRALNPDRPSLVAKMSEGDAATAEAAASRSCHGTWLPAHTEPPHLGAETWKAAGKA